MPPVDTFLQCFKFPENVGIAVLLVSETTFLASSQTGEEYGLRLYSFEGPTGTSTGEGPSPPTHIATFLFPPLVAGMGARIILKESCRGAFSSETDHRPFTTSKEAAMLSATFPTFGTSSSASGFRGAYKMLIHTSTFTSSQVAQLRFRSAQPENIQWASWGPKFTRLMPYTEEGVLFGYNIGYEGDQFNFNQLDIARDIHRAKTSTQDPRIRSTYLESFFDQDTPTTIPADGTFREDILTYLPFRWWHAQSPGCRLIPAEDWVYFTK